MAEWVSQSGDKPLEDEIDKLTQEIERLKRDGDPDGRISDLNEYMRVLYLKLKMALQNDPSRWG